MTAEVDWLLETLGSVADAQPDAHPLRRVDRGNALVYETGDTIDISQAMRELTNDLERANFVGIRAVDEDPTPIGTEYDHDLETVTNVRVIGMTGVGEWGHIDPSGSSGVPFGTLTREVRRGILAEREWPPVGRPNVAYHTIELRNIDDQSADWADYYRWEADVVFKGYESLP